MIDLTRIVRIGLAAGWTADAAKAQPRLNTHAGWPSIDAPGLFCEISVTCRGEPDSQTGYLLNIGEIDDAVRAAAIPWLSNVVSTPSNSWLPDLPELVRVVAAGLNRPVASLTIRLTPFLRFTILPPAMTTAIITQQFEFSASHRLHCPSLSDDENRRLFGKCNNANGHGHNYRVDVSAAVPLQDGAMSVGALEAIVHEQVVGRFDHKHLNLDTAEFRSLNPSVENIARVCHDLLCRPIQGVGAALKRVTVWETDRTCATYPADQ
jgi:6-pyruvoyltetrahydropterin/6-carboxytetrahydropterin synthase